MIIFDIKVEHWRFPCGTLVSKSGPRTTSAIGIAPRGRERRIANFHISAATWTFLEVLTALINRCEFGRKMPGVGGFFAFSPISKLF